MKKKISTRDSIRLYKRLVKYIRPYWLLMLFAVLAAVGLAGANTGIAGIVKKVMDDIFVQKNLAMLRLIPLAIVVLYLLKGLFDYFQEYLMGYVATRVVTDIRDEIYAHLQKLSLAFFTRNPTGILMSRIGNDTNLLQSTVSDSITNFLRDSLTIVGLTGYTFWVNWKLAAMSYLVILWALIPIRIFGNKSRKFSTKSQVKMADIAKFLYETITGIRIVKAFCMEEYENRRFSEENHRFFRIRVKRLRVRALASPPKDPWGRPYRYEREGLGGGDAERAGQFRLQRRFRPGEPLRPRRRGLPRRDGHRRSSHRAGYRRQRTPRRHRRQLRRLPGLAPARPSAPPPSPAGRRVARAAPRTPAAAG